jgi:hypothetical protein
VAAGRRPAGERGDIARFLLVGEGLELGGGGATSRSNIACMPSRSPMIARDRERSRDRCRFRLASSEFESLYDTGRLPQARTGP